MKKTLLAALLALPSLAEVRVWQGTFTLPTYQEDDPDPNPPFDAFPGTRFLNYPYTLRDRLTNRRVEQAWRALFLENEYLKCVVLPDIGGHLYTCTDKISGASMFYANPSIKKAQVSYRGAWAAFGVEFNFPVSHNWVSMSPVDFAAVTHSDGGASVWVANVDRVYGMQWRVELILRPGSTVLEQRMRLYNPRDVRHRFYWWNNAAVEVWDDSRIIYPQNYTASHGFTQIDTWPVNSQGRDLSVYGNHTRGSVSQFAHATREPFSGVYHPRTKAGVIRFSQPWEAWAKKIWSWGVSPEGRDWRRALSDNESAYVEVQGGLFRNQETFAFLAPQETLEFSEYWIPVRDIGGFARATLDAVVNFERGERVRLGINVNRAVAGGSLRVAQGGRLVAEEKVTLDPARAYFRELPPGGPYTVELADASGRTLIAHTEGKYDMAAPGEIKTGPQSSYRFPPAGQRSEGDFFDLGKDQEVNGRKLTALETYQDGLKRFPASFELNKACGRLSYDLKRYREAADHLAAAAGRVSNDAEIHYHLGLALAALNQPAKARVEWDRARTFREFRAPALIQLALLDSRLGNRAAALDLIRQAIAVEPKAVRAGLIEVALLRRAGETAAAKSRLSYWLEIDPTSAALRFEQAKAGAPSDALWPHLAADPERVLEVAAEYMNLGMYDDALDLLNRQYPAVDPSWSEPGALVPQKHPLVAYYRGYCRQRLGQPAAEDFRIASALSTRYVFPSRHETIPVLEAAIAANPNDAIARFLLGSLWMSAGLTDRAVGEWAQAERLNPAIPTLHRNLGYALLFLKKDYEGAAATLRQGLSHDRENPALYGGLDQALSVLGRPAGERVAVLERYPDPDRLPTALVYRRALALAEAGRAADAAKLFLNRFFAREETGINVREVYLEVELQRALELMRAGKKAEAQSAARAMSREKPGAEFTRDGLTVFLETPRFLYYLGEIESQAGDAAAARGQWEKAARGAGRSPYGSFFALLAKEKLAGKPDPDRTKQLESALARQGVSLDERGSPGLAQYTRGLLLQALGRKKEATDAFRQALLLPDRSLSHYLARTALKELSAP